ncbi:ModD protein [Polaromonas sp.]|uniref:ModD protein n=1 Tax=Polaromonas sp. TaxID=1869339 RepID=UPI001A2FEF1F|nr:ModD protein [Burkholderiales bacterium]
MRTLHDIALCALLDDDTPGGDLTTDSLDIGDQPARLEFRARQAMTVCASEEAQRLFELAGSEARRLMRSGTRAGAGEMILEAQGSAASLHQAWKTAQTLMEWASGIATATASIVAAAGGVTVACTRKNVPGTKALSIKAVRAGGGIMHRLGLSETLLVFAEHRLFLSDTPAQTIAQLRHAQPEKKIIVEVADLEEARRWADAGADVLQLEKFTPEAVAACRQALETMPAASRPLLAAAGGVRAGNAAAYVAAGAGLLVTSAPYTAPPQDVQVNFLLTA